MTSATQTVGLGALWIVTQPTRDSVLEDILFQATPGRFILQALGGLRGDEVIGWFAGKDEAERVAREALAVLKPLTAIQRDGGAEFEQYANPGIDY